MTILPVTYLGNVQYFTQLCLGGECVIDIHEHYVRQSYRNRCDILAANGPVALTVNVSQGRSINKVAVGDMRIDYSKRWQHLHWQSLVSAYRNSPYFDFYAELFEPFYTKRYDFLSDFDAGLTQTLLRAFGFPDTLKFSDRYIPPQECTPGSGLTDLRKVLAPRSAASQPHPSFSPAPYWQVFSDRMPFAPNLSAIDLLFCEGPAARDILQNSFIPLR